MPRKSKLQAEVERIVSAMPFSPALAQENPDRFSNLSDDLQYAVVAAVYRYYEIEGHSAGATRAKFAGVDPGKAGEKLGLPGPYRRKLFRCDTPALRRAQASNGGRNFADAIAPSYLAYGDDEPRAGSAHARMHGPIAEERKAAKLAAMQAEAEAEAKRAKRSEAARKAAATRKAAKAEAEAIASASADAGAES